MNLLWKIGDVVYSTNGCKLGSITNITERWLRRKNYQQFDGWSIEITFKGGGKHLIRWGPRKEQST